MRGVAAARAWPAVTWAIAFACAAAVLATRPASAATPGLALHPAQPAAADVVSVARYDLNCNADEPVREPIAGGSRIRIWATTIGIGFGGEQPFPCMQRLGVLGPGRHEIVMLGGFGSVPIEFGTTVVTIPDEPWPPEIDSWSFDPALLGAVDPNYRDVLVRLSGNRFAVATREADRDGVVLFGMAGNGSDWRRVERGFPGRMWITQLFADARDTLFAVAAVRKPSQPGWTWPATEPAAVWRLDAATQKWSRYAELTYPVSSISAAMIDGTLYAHERDIESTTLMAFAPSGGWRIVTEALPTYTQSVARSASDELYALLPGSGMSSQWKLARLRRTDGAIVASAPIEHPLYEPMQLLPDANGNLLIVAQTQYGSGFDPGPWALYRGDPAGGGWLPLATPVARRPNAPAADGSFLSVDKSGLLRLRRSDETFSAVASGGLGPLSVCGDLRPPYVGPFAQAACPDATWPPYGTLDIPRYGATQVMLDSSAVIIANANNAELFLWRDVINTAQGDGVLLDLTPLTALESLEYASVRPMRLVANADKSALYLLAHRFVEGVSVSALILRIDPAAKSASVVPTPALLASDLALAPNGDLVVTTRFGEVLRREGEAWRTVGALSTEYTDLHPAIDAFGRLIVYGWNGVLSQQGAVARLEEFHHAGLDHYFMTAFAAEAASLRDHPEGGWLPTGQSFPVAIAEPWINPSGGGFGMRPVCRFYGSVNPGPNSHFYTGNPAECGSLKALQQSTPDSEPRWNYEGIAFHALIGTAGGNCPATEQMLVRYFNGGSARGLTPNHRYVFGPTLNGQMSSAGWTIEFSAFCVLNDKFLRTYAR